MVICLNTSTGLTQKKCRMEGTQRRRRVMATDLEPSQRLDLIQIRGMGTKELTLKD